MAFSGPEGFFAERFNDIESFLLDADRTCLRLLVDPELRRLPWRFLEARESQEDFPHLLLSFTEPFNALDQWYAALLTSLDEAIDAEGETLDSLGAVTDAVPPDEFVQPWNLFLAKADALAESLPDQVGSLAFVFEPEEVTDRNNWVHGIRFLADNAQSDWLKFIVFESRIKVPLAELEDHPKVETLCFWLSPEEIEKRADDLIAATGGAPEAH